jgi:hypothetical protein
MRREDRTRSENEKRERDLETIFFPFLPGILNLLMLRK